MRAGDAGRRRRRPARRSRRERLWRRTRTGLLLTAIGLFLSWIPVAAVFGAVFLSFGSTFLFLGARAAGRRHEVAVLVAFLALTVGGVVVAVLVGSFVLLAYNAAVQGYPLTVLQGPGSLLIWATLPATFALAAGFGLQVQWLLSPRRRRLLGPLALLLAGTAVAATWLASPEVAMLAGGGVRTAVVVDFLLRVSFFRVVEAPAYVGLGALYLLAYWRLVPAGGPAPAPHSLAPAGGHR